MRSIASAGPWTTASTVPSRRLQTQPAMPSRSASWRIDSLKKTPCTRPWIVRRRVSRSLIAAHPPARALQHAALRLVLDAALASGPGGPGRHALPGHVVQVLEALGQAFERD